MILLFIKVAVVRSCTQFIVYVLIYYNNARFVYLSSFRGLPYYAAQSKFFGVRYLFKLIIDFLVMATIIPNIVPAAASLTSEFE